MVSEDGDATLRMRGENWKSAEEEGTSEDALWSYLWELADVYDVPLTNNYPSSRNGVQFRMVGDFLGDVREAFVRAGWRPSEQPKDADWASRFPDITPYEGEK